MSMCANICELIVSLINLKHFVLNAQRGFRLFRVWRELVIVRNEAATFKSNWGTSRSDFKASLSSQNRYETLVSVCGGNYSTSECLRGWTSSELGETLTLIVSISLTALETFNLISFHFVIKFNSSSKSLREFDALDVSSLSSNCKQKNANLFGFPPKLLLFLRLFSVEPIYSTLHVIDTLIMFVASEEV